MATTLSSGAVTANISGNVTSVQAIVPAGGTPVFYSTSSTGITTDTTIYTVTAGKTFYLMGLIMSGKTGNGMVQLYDEDNTKVIQMNASTAGTPVTGGAVPIAKSIATKNLKYSHNYGATNGLITMWGYEI